MWRRPTVGLVRASRLCSSTAAPSFVTSVRSAAQFKPDLSLVHIDPMVVEWEAPKDWANFTFPEKITELGDKIMALEETDTTILKNYLIIKLDASEDENRRRQQVVYQPGAVAAPAAAEAPKPVEEEKPKEKSSYKLVLTAVTDDAKIKVLKEVRVLKPGMKLLESKALVDKLPSVLKEDMSKEEGEEWKKKLQEVGATVELQ